MGEDNVIDLGSVRFTRARQKGLATPQEMTPEKCGDLKRQQENLADVYRRSFLPVIRDYALQIFFADQTRDLEKKKKVAPPCVYKDFMSPEVVFQDLNKWHLEIFKPKPDGYYGFRIRYEGEVFNPYFGEGFVASVMNRLPKSVNQDIDDRLDTGRSFVIPFTALVQEDGRINFHE